VRRVEKYNYAAQFDNIGTRFLPQVEALLRGGDYVLGAAVHEFETRLAGFLGVDHAVGVNSGTDALVLALDALGIGPGDEVVTVANSFHATAQAIVRRGATPIFVDCREDDFLIDLRQVTGAITPRTTAVIVVHLFGQAVDIARAGAICAAAGVWLVEDCAQAMGARSGGHRVGTRSAAGCWSFAPSKNLAAAGDAGAVSTGDGALAERLRLLRHFGQPVQNQHEVIGYNSRLDSLQALVLLHKLDQIDAWNAARRAVAAAYRQRLDRLPLRFQAGAPADGHVYHLFQVRAESRRVRDGLLSHLLQGGVDAVVRYPTPLHLQPALASCGYRRGMFPVAEALAEQTLCLPIRPDLGVDDIDYVCDLVCAFFKGNR
jgi:dTDP-4-amino-4,6-dideoxygalactose transaminase